MKYYLFLLALTTQVAVWAQSRCEKSSVVFHFDAQAHPRNFTERLGNHPQFPFLQYEKGITTPELVVRASRDSGSRGGYPVEFRSFNGLLKDIGFVRGYQDLKVRHIKNVFVAPGTIGNLGYYNKDVAGNAYIYVELNPAGEDKRGIAAWKITGPSGCWLYILHTCGNAFYPNEGIGECCRSVDVETKGDAFNLPAPVRERPMRVRIGFYKVLIVASSARRRKETGLDTDTVVSLVRSIDTVTRVRDSSGRGWKVSVKDARQHLLVCRDTVVELRPELVIDSSARPADSLFYVLADTVYVRLKGEERTGCNRKWELALDGGISYNSIPRPDNTLSGTRTDGGHAAGEIAIGRIFRPWFLAGVSAAYIPLRYQDDIVYPGTAANTYNTVRVGNMIPVQLWAKFVIGGPLRWQSNISFSAGYAFASKDEIENQGTVLTVKPGTKGGLTGGVKYDVAYFFNCRFGMALGVRGQYFSNKADAMNYHLIAMPVTLGIRYRF